MNFRKSQWLDTRTFTGVFGIQARMGGPWVHVAENGKPLFFKTESERDAKLAELRKTNRKPRRKPETKEGK